MRYLALSAALVALLSACKKVEKGLAPAPPKVKTVDDITGTYIGEMKAIRHTYAAPPGPGWIYDTMYYNDTVVITKLSADSFYVDGYEWTFQGRPLLFGYDTSHNFEKNYNYKDSLKIRFAADGEIQLRSYMGPSYTYSTSIQWADFKGKK
jgi:hypothetical protein